MRKPPPQHSSEGHLGTQTLPPQYGDGSQMSEKCVIIQVCRRGSLLLPAGLLKALSAESFGQQSSVGGSEEPSNAAGGKKFAEGNVLWDHAEVLTQQNLHVGTSINTVRMFIFFFLHLNKNKTAGGRKKPPHWCRFWEIILFCEPARFYDRFDLFVRFHGTNINSMYLPLEPDSTSEAWAPTNTAGSHDISFKWKCVYKRRGLCRKVSLQVNTSFSGKTWE